MIGRNLPSDLDTQHNTDSIADSTPHSSLRTQASHTSMVNPAPINISQHLIHIHIQTEARGRNACETQDEEEARKRRVPIAHPPAREMRSDGKPKHDENAKRNPSSSHNSPLHSQLSCSSLPDTLWLGVERKGKKD